MRGATDKRSFTVMIAKVNARLNAKTNITTYTYKCITCVGYNLDRTQLLYKEDLTTELMDINIEEIDQKVQLTIEQANAKLHQLEGAKGKNSKDKLMHMCTGLL
jgi:hypothetical protein